MKLGKSGTPTKSQPCLPTLTRPNLTLGPGVDSLSSTTHRSHSESLHSTTTSLAAETHDPGCREILFRLLVHAIGVGILRAIIAQLDQEGL